MRAAITGLLLLVAGCTGPLTPVDTDLNRPAYPGARAGSSVRGEVLAQTLCSGCHAVGRLDVSPLPDAPPLRGLAQRYPVTNLQEAFAEGVVTAHPAMPQFAFQEDDIADLIAFLNSVGSADVRP